MKGKLFAFVRVLIRNLPKLQPTKSLRFFWHTAAVNCRRDGSQSYSMFWKMAFKSSVANSMMCGVRSKASDRKSTRLNSSHQIISYAVFCLKKKKSELL